MKQTLRKLLLRAADSLASSPPSSDELRARVVEIARAELNNGDPEKYWVEAANVKPSQHLAWCGVFALWCLRRAGLTNAWWSFGRGFIYPIGLQTVSIRDAEPGDIAYFNRSQHHAIIIENRGDVLLLANGNYGGKHLADGRVAETETPSHKVTAIFSISSLIESRIRSES